MKPLEAVLLTLLGGFAALFLFLSQDYNPTAALFPRWIAIASLVFLAALLIRSFLGSDRVTETSEEAEPSSGAVSRPAVVAVQGAYILFIYVLGFFASTLLFLFIAPIQMRYARWGMALVQSVVVTLVLAGSFLWLFNIQLPTGAIWDLW